MSSEAVATVGLHDELPPWCRFFYVRRVDEQQTAVLIS
ncbi:Hypothetical protein A7982_05759 [Minicystis rosea]|nr:Hypothetical protein A7982_05759 [Minicystis rosea]